MRLASASFGLRRRVGAIYAFRRPPPSSDPATCDAALDCTLRRLHQLYDAAMLDDESHRDIKAYINRELLPRIEDLEVTREQKTRLFYISAVVSTALMLALLGIAGYTLQINSFATLEFAVAIGVIVVYGLALHGAFHLLFVRDARSEYVEEIAAPLIERIHPDIEYTSERRLTREDFEESRLAQIPVDRFESRDRFDVSIEGADVRCSEIEADCRVRKTDRTFGTRQRCYLLRGLFFSARLDDPFPGTTVVVPTLRRFANADELPRIEAGNDGEETVVRPAADWPHVEWSPDLHPEPIREVNLPDPEFHHLFDIYSTNLGESRDLFRPPVVERLKSVHSVWKSDVHRTPTTRTAGQGHFMLVIRDDHVYLGRPMPRKLAEIRAFDAADQVEFLVQFYRDVQLGIELIEGIAGRGRQRTDENRPLAVSPGSSSPAG